MNNAVLTTYPATDAWLVPASPELLAAIAPGARERACVRAPGFADSPGGPEPDPFAGLGAPEPDPYAGLGGPAWACIVAENGEAVVLGAGGARLAGTYAGCWLWLSDAARGRGRLLYRTARSFLAGLEQDFGVVTMRASAVANDAVAARFLRHLDFHFCGVEPVHGDTGLPAAIYERRAA